MAFLDTFNRSYGRIVGPRVKLTSQSNDFFEYFYQRFLAAAPEVAVAFAHAQGSRHYLHALHARPACRDRAAGDRVDGDRDPRSKT